MLGLRRTPSGARTLAPLGSRLTRPGRGRGAARPRRPAWPGGRAGGAAAAAVAAGRLDDGQVGHAVLGQLVVRGVAHQLAQLGLVGAEDRLAADVRLGVAAAVPVQVVAARAPAAPVVLGDRGLEVGRAVGALDLAVGAADRQLPADVGLDRVRRQAGAQRPPGAGRSRRRRGSRDG